MTRLSNFREFIDLIEKDWSDDDHNYKYFDDRLSGLLSGVTSELQTLPTKQKKKILEQINAQLEENGISPDRDRELDGDILFSGVNFETSISIFSLFRSAFSWFGSIFTRSRHTDINRDIPFKIKLLVKAKLKIEKNRKKQEINNSQPQETESKTDIKNPAIKPIFKPEEIPTIFDILKNYFSTADQKQLLQILNTGNDASQKLIFLNNGNRLADSFKHLVDAGIITGCEKRELENWIFRNFKYRNNGIINCFTLRYLNDIISSANNMCRNPLLKVSRDKAKGNVTISRIQTRRRNDLSDS